MNPHTFGHEKRRTFSGQVMNVLGHLQIVSFKVVIKATTICVRVFSLNSK